MQMIITPDMWAECDDAQLQWFRGLFGLDVDWAEEAEAVDCETGEFHVIGYCLSFNDGRHQIFDDADIAWMQAQAALLRACKAIRTN